MSNQLIISLLISCMTFIGCNQAQSPAAALEGEEAFLVNRRGDTIPRVSLSEAEWRSRLNETEFKILREEGTERAFTGAYWNYKQKGIYVCKGCGLPLFSSNTKYDSGTGWPSYYEPLDSAYVHETVDTRLGMERTEVSCARCGGHLGHVFSDGPPPTGLRYCINSVSLDFSIVEEEETK